VSRYRHEIDNVRAHVRSLQGVIGILVLVVAGLGIGWSQAPRRITVHLPPDLRAGATFAVNEIPAASVYAFTYYIFQQLNRWPDDGAQDYGRAIFRVAAYLTPAYRAWLIADMEHKARQGELSYRVRGIQEYPGRAYSEARVEVVDRDTWLVWLDLDLVESVKGMTVKQTAIRYPLRVVRQAVDLEANPWGLALDHYGPTGPQRLSEADLKQPFARVSHAP
jgi:integrating conjugative element protein (TIGR03746 family)